MPYPVQRYVKQLNQFCVAEGAFSENEVDQIIDLEDLQKFHKGGVGNGGGGGKVNKKARDSEVMWIHHDPNSDWLFQKFSHLTSMINYDHFMYDIEGFENFQYTRYRKGEFYDWHTDSGDVWATFERKISATIVLTDPEEYEGGEFQCVLGGRVDEPLTIKPKKGDAVFFASWMPHRVLPITKGVRKSLVCWVMGRRNF
jgi:PKHD-type hydroxylase